MDNNESENQIWKHIAFRSETMQSSILASTGRLNIEIEDGMRVSSYGKNSYIAISAMIKDEKRVIRRTFWVIRTDMQGDTRVLTVDNPVFVLFWVSQQTEVIKNMEKIFTHFRKIDFDISTIDYKILRDYVVGGASNNMIIRRMKCE